MSHYRHWDPINGVPLNQPMQYPPRHAAKTARYSRYNDSYSFGNPAGAGDLWGLLDYWGPYPVPQLQSALNILREQMSNTRREKLTRIKRKIGFLPDGSHDTALTGWGDASCRFSNKEDFAEVLSTPANKKQRRESEATLTSDNNSASTSVVSLSSGLDSDSVEFWRD